MQSLSTYEKNYSTGNFKIIKEENNYIEIDKKIIQRARGAIERMIAVGR